MEYQGCPLTEPAAILKPIRRTQGQLLALQPSEQIPSDQRENQARISLQIPGMLPNESGPEAGAAKTNNPDANQDAIYHPLVFPNAPVEMEIKDFKSEKVSLACKEAGSV